MTFWIILIAVSLALVFALRDAFQNEHAILRNFPLLGRCRYWLEMLGPELRQYIVAGNNEERPFTRDERSWVYASAKKQNNYFGFGTDNDLELTPNFLIIKQTAFPINDPKPGDREYDALHSIECAKTMGIWRQRQLPYRPTSVVNLSAMSYGSLSGAAVEALNRGARLAGCLQNTGEGGISQHHQKGGDLIYQIGTGYFGCRDKNGNFDMAQFVDLMKSNPVRAVEIKISQGAKPGRGGVLPAAKITPEISAIRGIPMGQDCISPSRHTAFSDVDSLLDFVEQLASASGLPIGIKSAVGQLDFWHDLALQMATTDRGVDFVSVDGAEGGTGAAPLVFADHVSMPFKIGFTRVKQVFELYELADHIVFNGSGKLGFPEAALLAFALGCDTISVAREGMLSIGCIQAQKCQTGHCPTGIATQNRWLARGLDPTSKATRFANYVVTLRKEIMQLCRACGIDHPSRIRHDHFEFIQSNFKSLGLEQLIQNDNESAGIETRIKAAGAALQLSQLP